MTSHNSFFGWVHFFKINNNNLISSSAGDVGLLETPYPQIIVNPTLVQILNNWNRADTGLALTTLIAGTLMGYPSNKKGYNTHNFQKRKNFGVCIAVTGFVALTFGLLNSSYRLEGLVPNGLKANPVVEPVKYNLTGPLL